MIKKIIYSQLMFWKALGSEYEALFPQRIVLYVVGKLKEAPTPMYAETLHQVLAGGRCGWARYYARCAYAWLGSSSHQLAPNSGFFL